MKRWVVGIHKKRPISVAILFVFFSDVENGGEALMEDQFDDADNDDNMEQ